MKMHKKHWLVNGVLHTTKGPKDESTLRKVEGFAPHENGRTTHWIEFYDGPELVHRSVWVGFHDHENQP